MTNYLSLCRAVALSARVCVCVCCRYICVGCRSLCAFVSVCQCLSLAVCVCISMIRCITSLPLTPPHPHPHHTTGPDPGQPRRGRHGFCAPQHQKWARLQQEQQPTGALRRRCIPRAANPFATSNDPQTSAISLPGVDDWPGNPGDYHGADQDRAAHFGRQEQGGIFQAAPGGTLPSTQPQLPS